MLHRPSRLKCVFTGLSQKRSSFETWSLFLRFVVEYEIQRQDFPCVLKVSTVSIVLQVLHMFILFLSSQYSYQNDSEASTGNLHKKVYLLHRETNLVQIFLSVLKN